MGHWVVAGGRPATFEIPGAVLFAACGSLGVGDKAQTIVRFWFEGSLEGPAGPKRTFQALRTGQVIPAGAVYIRSAMDPDGTTAWHLFELFDGMEGEGT